MTDEERKAKDAARKREAYARRKKAQAELSNNLPTPQEELALRIAKANGIDVPPGVLYQDSREKAEATISEAVAREEYIAFLLKPYAKSTNLPELLQGVIRELITLRVTLTDLIGGLNK